MFLNTITAFILAGGLGTRLGGVLSRGTQKTMAPVAGRPFMAYVLDWLARNGVQDVVLCVGHGWEADPSDLEALRLPGIQLRYSLEEQRLGTGGAVWNAIPLAQSSTILAMNGDSLCPAALAPILRYHFEVDADATLVVCPQPDASRFGRIAFRDDGRVLGFDEKPARCGNLAYINAGIYFIETRLFPARMPPSPVSMEYDLIPGWLEDEGVYAYPVEAPFLDIGTPESYRQAEAFVRELPWL